MKLIHLSIAALACLSIASLAQSAGLDELDKEDPVRVRWEGYKSKHNKVYSGSDEESYRFELFISRLRAINKYNAESRDMRLEANQLSDRTEAELKQMNGLRMSKEVKKQSPQELGISKLLAKDDPPAYLNWADKGIVGPVRNQGMCGSCWAFATAGLLEGQEGRNSTGSLAPLSEQQLVDCDRDKNLGCKGGLMSDALTYIKQVGGLQVDKDYPYSSVWGRDSFKCQFDQTKAFVSTRRLKEPAILELKTEDELKTMLAKYGPIAIAIDASLTSFFFYRSGVYYDKACSSSNLNHAVLLVGYGTTREGIDYWIIKNSWSTWWGNNGYMWLARNRANHCGVLVMPTISISE